MYNKKLLSKIDLGKYSKPNPYKKDIIYDPMGQWKYPGQPTRIPSSNITMKGVNFPVLAVTDNGQKKMMQPGQEYNFPGANYVDEFPQAKKGGSLKSKKYTRSLDGIGSLFVESALFQKPKNNKKRIFHPKAKYYADGGEPCEQGFERDPVTGKCIPIREKVEDIEEMPSPIVQKPPYYQESFINPAAYVSGYRGGDPRMYKYGFLNSDQGNVVGGGGFGFPKPGVHLNASAVVPTSSNDRQYFKGAYEAGISKDFKNLNLGLGVNTAITGYPGEKGFVSDPIKFQPKLNLRYNFKEGGEPCPQGQYRDPETGNCVYNFPMDKVQKKEPVYNNPIKPKPIVPVKSSKEKEAAAQKLFDEADFSDTTLAINKALNDNGLTTNSFTTENGNTFPIFDSKGEYASPEAETWVNNRFNQRYVENQQKNNYNDGALEGVHPEILAMAPAGSLAAIPEGITNFGTSLLGQGLSTAIPLGETVTAATAGSLTPFNILSSYFGADAVLNQFPGAISDAGKGEYYDATEKALWGTLGLAGLGIGKGVVSGAKDLGKALNTESGLLSKTHKINPWRFKANPEAYYHRSPNLENIINRETGTLQGFGNSKAGIEFSKDAGPGGTGGLAIRGDGSLSTINLKKPANSQLYFAKGVPLDGGRYNKVLNKKTGKLIDGQKYEGPYMVEVEGVPMGSSTKGRKPGAEPLGIGNYAVSRRPISLDEAKFYKEHWLQGYKEVPKELPGSPNTVDNVQKAGFLNPLALLDRITPRLPAITKVLGMEDDVINHSPLNLIPGYGKKLAQPGFTHPINSGNTEITAYRKFGNSLDDVITSKTFRPQGGFRMGAKQVQTEGNWAEPGIANENYKGVFAAGMDPRVAGTNIQLQRWSKRNGVVGMTKQGNPAIPVTDPGLQFHRRLPFSNRYVPIDKQKLIDNKFQLATQLPHVQSLIEKYGIAAAYGLISGYLANGKEGAIENLKTVNQYTVDPIINWSNTAWDDLENKLNQKKDGGLHKFVGGGMPDPGDVTCPEGYEINTITGRCVLIKGEPGFIKNDVGEWVQDVAGKTVVEDENDERYKDYLIRKHLSDISKISDWTYKNMIFEDFTKSINDPNSTDYNDYWKQYYDPEKGYDFTLDGTQDDVGDLTNKGSYGSKVQLFNNLTDNQFDNATGQKLLNDQGFPTYESLYVDNNSEYKLKNYKPDSYLGRASLYNTLSSYYAQPASRWATPNTDIVEDVIDREKLKKAFPDITDQDINDHYRYYSQSYISNAVAPKGYFLRENYYDYDNLWNTKMSSLNDNIFKDYVNSTKKLDSKLIKDNNVYYKPESVVDDITTSFDILPYYSEPIDKYIVKKTVDNVDPSVELYTNPDAPEYSPSYPKNRIGYDKYNWYTTKSGLPKRQRNTGGFYDKMSKKVKDLQNYMEGYDDEEGNHIPGEIENAEKEGRQLNFQGNSSKADKEAQETYVQDWTQYQIDKEAVKKQNIELLQKYNLSTEEYLAANKKYGGGLNNFAEGGASGCPRGFHWNGTKCVRDTNTFRQATRVFRGNQYLYKKPVKPVVIKQTSPPVEKEPIEEEIDLRLPPLKPGLLPQQNYELQGTYEEDQVPEYSPSYPENRIGYDKYNWNSGKQVGMGTKWTLPKRQSNTGGFNNKMSKKVEDIKNYMEGYEDEEGNYIPGEIEKAEQEGRQLQFKGNSSVADKKAQKNYNKEYDEYENLKNYQNGIMNSMQYKLNKKQGGSISKYNINTEHDLTDAEVARLKKLGYKLEKL